MSDKLVLIDGHSILNRAFYGVPELSNSNGLHTNAIYGFLNIMFKIIDEEKPDYLVVAFDVKAPTFRHKMFENYKGTRKPMPDELREQVPVMKETLTAMNIAIVEQPGYEADDILGTLAKKAEKVGMQVALISGDRDLLQIASDNIKIRIPKTKGGKTEIEDYYAKDVIDKYGVTPLQFIDLKALMGDTADNIPGVPKVGEKTATELIVQFKSLEVLYDNLDKVNKKSIQQSLTEHQDLAFLSQKLATIFIECELPITFEDARIKDIYNEKSFDKFKQLEFKGFFQRFSDAAKEEVHEEKYTVVTSKTDAEKIFQKASKSKHIGITCVFIEDSETEKIDKDGQMSFFEKPKEKFLCVALSMNDNEAFFMCNQSELSTSFITQHLRQVCKDTEISIFDVKKNYETFIIGENEGDSKVITKNFFDGIIAAYLLNPLKNDYMPEDVALEFLHRTLPGYAQLFGKKKCDVVYKEQQEEFITYLCREAILAFTVKTVLSDKLKKSEMYQLFRDIEMPLTYVLYSMQKVGIRILPNELSDYGKKLNEQIEQLEKEIVNEAGCEFNINSPKQLGEVLFEQMKLPGGKKTKTGYSTAADVLEKMSQEYPFVKMILEYRGLTKLKSTYVDGLNAVIKEDGKIHSTFNQTITATGRISSTDPNLQNIPIRMEMGRLIRKAFVPKEGYIFMDADYSQIELRILAHMSKDAQLIEAYTMAEDIHRITASKVFHTPLNEVTAIQRRNAKAVNFGIVYGISSFGLSQDLSISTKEANTYIQEYFETYPGIKRFLDCCVNDAKENGFSETMYHRRRPVPELKSSNFMQRSFGERVAMNAPIQGTAADIMKIAMINLHDELIKNHLRSRIVVQVHDELLLEVYLPEQELVEKLLTDSMEHAAELAVHLEIDVHTGTNWYEAK